MPIRKIVLAPALLLSANFLLAAAADLPKAESILDRYVAVTGGRAAYLKKHVEFSSGTVEIVAAGLKGTVVSYRAEPNRSCMAMEFPMIGKLIQGTDGEIAWSLTPQGPKLKEGDERAIAIMAGRFNSEIHWKDLYKRVETVGTESVDGKEAYIVVLTPKEGKPITQYYDVHSNLMVKLILKEQAATGEVRVESIVSDYRKEGGILTPHQIVQKGAGQEIVIRNDTFKFNEEPPAGTFDPPAEVKALLGK